MDDFGRNGFDIKTVDPVIRQPSGKSKIHPMTPEQNGGFGPQALTQQPQPLLQFGTAPNQAPPPQYGMTQPYGMPPTTPQMTQFGMAPPQMPQYGIPPPLMMTPPGLAYLSTMDNIIVKQEIDLLEVVTGFETQNRYKILTPQGLLIFNAEEKSDTCDRQCFGAARAFTLEVNDLAGQPLVLLDRPFTCCGLHEMSVFSPPGVLAGRIQQEWSFSPRFSVIDAEGLTVFRIEGPMCTGGCSCSDVDFQVFSALADTEVGKISKKWAGMLQEAYTNADTFGISFPVDLAISMKAVLLGACFLIDFVYFEQPKNHRRY